MTTSEELLNIEPQELSFRFELMKRASCTIRLSSNSSRHVAFKVLTTSPEKYVVRPNNGILSPGSTCDVEVTMRAPEEIPPNMECRDMFLIKSVAASPDDTLARTKKLFNDRAHAVGNYKVRVVYVLPQHQQPPNFDTSGRGSSLNGSILPERSLSGTQVEGKKERLVDNLYIKGIAILFLTLIFWYLIMTILRVICSALLPPPHLLRHDHDSPRRPPSGLLRRDHESARRPPPDLLRRDHDSHRLPPAGPAPSRPRLPPPDLLSRDHDNSPRRPLPDMLRRDPESPRRPPLDMLRRDHNSPRRPPPDLLRRDLDSPRRPPPDLLRRDHNSHRSPSPPRPAARLIPRRSPVPASATTVAISATIRSWTLVVIFFVLKMAKKLVSDSVEDWVVKTLVYICLHFFTVVFRRKGSRSGQESGVPGVG